MRARLLSYICALALVSASLGAAHVASGCAAALPFIVKVARVIAKITGIVDLIDSQAQTASDNGVLPPEVAKRIKAVRAIVARLNDAAQLGPAAFQAVASEFERAYADLLVVVAPLGVRVAPAGGRLAAAAPGTVNVPSAGELRAELEREAAQ